MLQPTCNEGRRSTSIDPTQAYCETADPFVPREVVLAAKDNRHSRTKKGDRVFELHTRLIGCASLSERLHETGHC